MKQMFMQRIRRPFWLAGGWLALGLFTLMLYGNGSLLAHGPDAEGPSADAVQRTRDKANELDDIFKKVIVLITDKYVHDDTDFPAGSAAVLLFKQISDSGPQKIRLIDATGKPRVAANVAKDAFERNGILRLKEGDKSVEQVVKTKEGDYQLRVLTPVPVVMDKCIMCHDHYGEAEEGEPIGAISYALPVR